MRTHHYFSLSWAVIGLIFVLGLGGWIANIVKLINAGFEVAQWGGMEIARIIGIFMAPLGAILGYF